MPDAVQVITTTDSQQTALAIAQDLVDSQLAACVQVGGPVHSVYRWQGQIETATEWTCTIKTVRSLFSAVAARIRQLHNYEVPEVLLVPVTDGSPDYLTWLRAQVHESDA
jgi:periplasmic divalent cation tolerance protein